MLIANLRKVRWLRVHRLPNFWENFNWKIAMVDWIGTAFVAGLLLFAVYYLTGMDRVPWDIIFWAFLFSVVPRYYRAGVQTHDAAEELWRRMEQERIMHMHAAIAGLALQEGGAIVGNVDENGNIEYRRLDNED